MKKVILGSISTCLFFLLLTVFVILQRIIYDMPYSDAQTETQWHIQLGFFVLLIAVFIFKAIVISRYKGSFRKSLTYNKQVETDPDDEREMMITAGAVLYAFRTLTFSLLISIALISVLSFSSAEQYVSENFLFVATLGLLCACVILSYTVYCVTWCRAYRR
jgi:hypothetical protein